MTWVARTNTRVAPTTLLSPSRNLATATSHPTMGFSFPRGGDVREGNIDGTTGYLVTAVDPATAGYMLAVKRGSEAAISFQFVVGHATDAAAKHAKWRFVGLRRRLIALDRGNSHLWDPVPLIEIGVFGGSLIAETNDPVRPKSGTYSASGSGKLAWADTIDVAAGEAFIEAEAYQIIQANDMRAELQINTMGCEYIIALPACKASVSPGSDACAATGAIRGDI